MKNSDVHSPADKIAFIQAPLQPGSRALSLVQSTAFASRKIWQDYDKFRENFLSVFSGGAETTIVRQVNHAVETSIASLSSQNLWDASIAANTLTEVCITILEQAR